MVALPAASDFTGATVTEGNFKTALTVLRDFLSGLLGTDGVPATALATLGALGAGYSAKSAAYTVVSSDRGKVIDATSGTWTLSLPAVSGLSGFSLVVWNSGSGTVTIDPNASEQINGATTLALTAGSAVLLACNGTSWGAMWMMAPNSAAQNLKAPLDSPTFTGTPGASVPFRFADGTVSLPSMTFGADLDTGFYRPAANTLALSTGGGMAWQVDANNNIFFGSPNAISGIGTARFSSQGTGTAGGTWALGKFGANAVAAQIALGKSRGATVDSYTIVNAGDNLGNIEFWGSDGSTMIRGAYIQGYNIGTPAAGDVRAGVRVYTGSGADATALRLSIDDATIAATLPVTSTGPITQGFAALGTVAPGALAFATAPGKSVTPNATGTFTTTVPPAGTVCTLIITTTGTTSFTLTFGTGFVSQGTLATGTVSGKVFTLSFISNGTSVIEQSRTAAM